mgnify:CR=1 FL=1
MIDKPLYDNPLGGGFKTLQPGLGGPAERISGPSFIDPIMQGFQDSEFRKNANMMQQDAVNFKYKGQDMMMNGSMSGAFKQYLDSIGKGDLYEGTAGLSEPLATVQDTINPNDPYNLGSAKPGVNPIVSGPEGIESTATAPGVGQDIFGNNPAEIAVPSNPFNRVGQQLMGPNQDDILGTLKNIEQGIASLGQGGMDQSSFGGFNNNFGIGSFFPPYGGMYGQ